MKKILPIVVLLTMLLSACSQAAPTTPPAASQPTQAPAPTQAAPTKAAEPVTLTMLTWRYEDKGWVQLYEAIKAEFEAKYPGVKIELGKEPVSSYPNKMLTLFTAKTPPDIVHLPSSNMYQFVNEGFFEPLDKYAGAKDIFANSIDSQKNMIVNGQTYGYLLEAYGSAILWNEKLFKEAGIDKFPDKFNSAAEFVELAKKLTRDVNKDGVTDVYGLAQSNTKELALFTSVTDLLMMEGIHWAKAGVPTANSPEVAAAVKAYKDLIDSGASPKGVSQADARKLFFEEKAAMIIEGPWGVTQAIGANPKIEANLRVALPPTRLIRGGTSNMLGLPAGGKNNAMAWNFIAMWSLPKYQEMYANLVGVPAQKGAVTEAIIKAKPYMQIFANATEKSVDRIPPGFEVQYSQFWAKSVDAILDVVANNKPVNETMEKLQADLLLLNK